MHAFYRLRMDKHACVGLSHGCAIAELPTVHIGRIWNSYSAGFYNTETCPRKRREGVAHASLRPAETFMRVCLRPMEAACFCVRKCANNRQMIDAGIQRFYNTHAQLASVSYKHAKRCVRYVYICKHWLPYFSYTETVTRMRVLHEDEICFT